MNSYSYITIEEALDIHLKTVENSGGGMNQCIDRNRLDSVLNHIQNDDYYPEFVDKLTHLFFCICKFHFQISLIISKISFTSSVISLAAGLVRLYSLTDFPSENAFL